MKIRRDSAPQLRIVPGKGASAAPAGSGAAEADRLLLKNATANNRVTLHVSPEASHQAILDSIRTAKHSYTIETFIWHNDAAGREIIQALADRKRELAAQGQPFEVRVLIDWLGLRQGSGGSEDADVVRQMREHGFEVREFSPGYYSKSAKALIPITHRKFYIADGDQFISGGRNIGNEYLKPSYDVASKPGFFQRLWARLTGGKAEPTVTPEHSWHDLLYTVRGPETGRVLDEFYQNWERAGGQRPAKMPAILRDGGGQARIESVVTDPHAKEFGLRDAHFGAIRGARREIVAIYPYFSDDDLVNELIQAKQARPDLKIRVMMPANKEASHEGTVYSLLNKETAHQLLKAGVEVRMFEGGELDGKAVQRFSHMKGMVVDGELLSIGSANGDARTFNNNHELNTLISDPATVRDYMKRIVEPDWASAQPVTLEELESAPLSERLKRKALEALDSLL